MAKSGPVRSGGRALLSADSRHSAETGTALANYSYTPSCGLEPAMPRQPSSWGGARNRADRVSWHLSERHVYGMIEAAAYAEKIGLAFNRHWTVHYERAGIADQDARRFIGHLLRLASAYARRHGGQIAAVWAREAGEGKGGHVHILLHLPAGLSLRNRTRRWIVLAGGNRRVRVSRVKPIGGRLSCAAELSEHYRVNIDNVRRYQLKGADDGSGNNAGKALGLRRYGEGGLIIGKRCGWTQNIGIGARIARVADKSSR